MNRSEQINELVTALIKAQQEFKPVYKGNENPQFHSKYADLATVIGAVTPALNANGLAVIQSVRCVVDPKPLTEIETMLVHTSGQWLSDVLQLPATMRNDFTAQTIGSSCTYGRRYALQAILGISADKDDDATDASGGGSKADAQAVAQEKLSDKKKVSVTYSDDGLMFLWGPGAALQNVHNALKAAAGKPNIEGMWTVPAKDAMGIVECLGENGVEVIEAEFPRQKAEEAAPRPSPSSRVALPADEVRGILSDVKMLKTKKGQPFMTVTIDGVSGSVFDNADMELVGGEVVKIFTLLLAAKGELAHAIVQKNGQYTNFTAFRQIGQDAWDLVPDSPPLPVRQAKLL